MEPSTQNSHQTETSGPAETSESKPTGNRPIANDLNDSIESSSENHSLETSTEEEISLQVLSDVLNGETTVAHDFLQETIDVLPEFKFDEQATPLPPASLQAAFQVAFESEQQEVTEETLPLNETAQIIPPAGLIEIVASTETSLEEGALTTEFNDFSLDSSTVTTTETSSVNEEIVKQVGLEQEQLSVPRNIDSEGLPPEILPVENHSAHEQIVPQIDRLADENSQQLENESANELSNTEPAPSQDVDVSLGNVAVHSGPEESGIQKDDGQTSLHHNPDQTASDENQQPDDAGVASSRRQQLEATPVLPEPTKNVETDKADQLSQASHPAAVRSLKSQVIDAKPTQSQPELVEATKPGEKVGANNTEQSGDKNPSVNTNSAQQNFSQRLLNANESRSIPLEQLPINPGSAEGVSRLADMMQNAMQQGRPMRVRLNPPELGILQIEVSIQGGAVSARFDVQTSIAHQTVLDNLSTLHEALAQHGTTVDRIDVQLSDFTTEDRSSQFENQAEQQEQQADQNSKNPQHQDRSAADGESHQPEENADDVPASEGTLDQLDIAI
ncbi:MAG: hypothetical protein Tsb009_02360 [Planctomycetaceae bacterium]